MFYNHNQGVEAKIYNKYVDMRNHGFEIGDLQGLLRFELTLKRQYLLKKGLVTDKHLTFGQLQTLLGYDLDQAPVQKHTHLISPLHGGAMLSRELLEMLLHRKCEGKVVRCANMIAYAQNVNKFGFYDEPTAEKHFSAYGVSPLYLKGEIHYLPSFADLLAGRRDERLETFMGYR